MTRDDYKELRDTMETIGWSSQLPAGAFSDSMILSMLLYLSQEGWIKGDVWKSPGAGSPAEITRLIKANPLYDLYRI